MTGSSKVERNMSISVDDMEPNEDLSVTPDSPTNNHDDTSPANITAYEDQQKLPDGDSRTLQLFSVGDKLGRSQSNPGVRDGSGGSEKGQITRHKRLSLPSKVGHIGNTNQNVETSKPSSVTTHEKNSTDSSHGNGKASRSARYIWASIKRKLRSRRGGRETTVKEIHILPEEGEDKWANRSFGDYSNSNSSSTSSSRVGSSGSKGNRQGMPREKANYDVMQSNGGYDEDSLHSPVNR